MVELNRLRTFRAVLAAGSVSRAAANLSFTPSAVSQQIHALQRELGLTLIERQGRGIAPTAHGRRIAEQAETLLACATQFEDLATDLRAGRTGSLTVTHLMSVGALWLPDIVRTLAQEYPDLRVDLRAWEHTHQDSESDVEVFVQPLPTNRTPGRLDEPNSTAAARSTTVDRTNHMGEELVSEPYLVVLPRTHRLAGHREVALSELTGEDWVDNDVPTGPCRQILLEACASHGFTPTFRVETQTEAAAVAFVEAGAGITIMPGLTFRSTRPDPAKVTTAVLVDPAPVRTLMMRTRPGLTGNPAVQRLCELIRERAATECSPGEAGQAPAKSSTNPARACGAEYMGQWPESMST